MRYVNEPTPGSTADLGDDADPEQVARTILLRRLSSAPRTRQELADDLRKRGLPDDVAERVLNRFTEVGLIDDAEYAQMWVNSRQRTRGTARSVLRQELRAKGVSDDDALPALDGIDPEAERQRARGLVEAKAARMSSADVATRTRRLVGMLVRRGYPSGIAYAVVSDVLAAEHDDSGAVE